VLGAHGAKIAMGADEMSHEMSDDDDQAMMMIMRWCVCDLLGERWVYRSFCAQLCRD